MRRRACRHYLYFASIAVAKMDQLVTPRQETPRMLESEIVDYSIFKESVNQDELSDLSVGGDTSFDNHWSAADDNLPIQKINNAADFLKPILEHFHKKSLVLDAGCGDGVHAYWLKENLRIQAQRFYFIDISRAALSKTKSVAPLDSKFLKADLCALPFKDDIFDIAFSYGVIGYTEDPRVAINELIRVTKSGGVCGFWVLPKMKGVAGFSFSILRMGMKLSEILYLGNAYISFVTLLWGFFPTKSKMAVWNSPWKAVKEVVAVNLKPRKLQTPMEEEIRSWLKSSEVEILSDNKESLLTIWMKKK